MLGLVVAVVAVFFLIRLTMALLDRPSRSNDN
jgi:hypothetical protein